MPNLYARATALPNVVGRCDYVSNPNRQENLLAVYDGAQKLLDGGYWTMLAQESQAAFDMYGQKTRTVKNRKTGELEERQLRCCQGRETVIQLPNSILEKMKPEKVARVIAQEYKKKLGLTVLVAVHYNAKKNNLHAHVIFLERQLMAEPVIKVAERNLFFDADGKRVYKKSEILDENKELLPGCRIVKKGEVYEQRYFTAANPKYHSQKWLKHAKTNVILPLLNGKLRGDVPIKEYDKSTGELPYQHVGKNLLGDRKADVEAYNSLVKHFNERVRSGDIPLAAALQIQQKVFASNAKTGTLQAELNALRMERENLQRQIMGTELITVLNVVKKMKDDAVELERKLQPVYEIAEVAGLSKPQINQMYDTISKASRADMQELWGRYKDSKNEFWGEYNAQMQDIRNEMNALYRRRKLAKTMDWIADPRNNESSLLGLIIVLIYTIFSKETVSSLDFEIETLKNRRDNLRKEAAEFKNVTSHASETLRTSGKALTEYVDSILKMQHLADKMRGIYAPFLSPAPAPMREPPPERPKQPVPIQKPAASSEGKVALGGQIAAATQKRDTDLQARRQQAQPPSYSYFAGLISADARLQKAEIAHSNIKSHFEREYGALRPVNYGLLNLPKKLESAISVLKSDLELLDEINAQLKTQPPEKPGLLAGKKKKEQYEHDNTAYWKARSEAQAAKTAVNEEIQKQLDILRPYMGAEYMMKQGYGYNAPQIMPENIDRNDLWELSKRVDFLLRRSGSIGVKVAAEERYKEDLRKLTTAEKALEAARTDYATELNKIPEEYRSAAQEALEVARSRQIEREKPTQTQLQPQKRKVTEKER